MRELHVTFASSNPGKYLEARQILSDFGIQVRHARLDLPEMQADSLAEISEGKARAAYSLTKTPVFVEDDGLFINSLNGFPGQYSSFAFKSIGNAGILKLLLGSDDRAATFRSAIAYCDDRTVSISEGLVAGRISDNITAGGWGFDPIFVPEGSTLTFAQMGAEKNNYSHRRRALEKFAGWLLDYDGTPKA